MEKAPRSFNLRGVFRLDLPLLVAETGTPAITPIQSPIAQRHTLLAQRMRTLLGVDRSIPNKTSDFRDRK